MDTINEYLEVFILTFLTILISYDIVFMYVYIVTIMYKFLLKVQVFCAKINFFYGTGHLKTKQSDKISNHNLPSLVISAISISKSRISSSFPYNKSHDIYPTKCFEIIIIIMSSG